MTGLILGALFLGTSTWLITWLVTAWADREHARQQEERQRLDKIMKASPPRASGLRGDHRRVS